MTAIEELVSRIEPDLKTAVKQAKNLNWMQRQVGGLIVSWLATLAIQVFLSYAGPILLELFSKFLPILRDLVRPEYQPELDLVNRVLNQSPMTYDPAVRAASIRPVAPMTALRNKP